MTNEAIHLNEEYYLLASAFLQRRPQVLLTHAESFAIYDIAAPPSSRMDCFTVVPGF